MSNKEEDTLRLKAKPEIRLIAEMAAMMTFRESESSKNEWILAYPEILREKQDLFSFGMIYGCTLTELKFGIQQIPADFDRHFEHLQEQYAEA